MKIKSPLSKEAPEPISGAKPTQSASGLETARSENPEVAPTKRNPALKRRRTFLEAAAMWVIARR